jgi:hypothetical protein
VWTASCPLPGPSSANRKTVQTLALRFLSCLPPTSRFATRPGASRPANHQQCPPGGRRVEGPSLMMAVHPEAG